MCLTIKRQLICSLYYVNETIAMCEKKRRWRHSLQNGQEETNNAYNVFLENLGSKSEPQYVTGIPLY